MEVKNNSQKIILVLFPLIINKFDFPVGEQAFFFDPGQIRKKTWQGQEKNLTSEEIHKLVDIDYSQEVKEFIQHNPNSKLVLVNYPHNQQQFTTLSTELAKEGKKISNIILLNISNYELILSLKKEYFICPLCQKIYKQAETIKENKNFICPQDSEYQFSLADISKFNDFIIEYHLKNTKSVLEKFLAENKISASAIIQLTVQKKEDILSGETQKSLLKIIESL